jgi:hypothetical protein
MGISGDAALKGNLRRRRSFKNWWRDRTTNVLPSTSPLANCRPSLQDRVGSSTKLNLDERRKRSSMEQPDQSVEYKTWQSRVLSALAESDKDELKDKIMAAEDAMFRRGLELQADGDAERSAMLQCARQLRGLMVSVLGYPAAEELDEA